jgi:hypothetical protein
MTVLRWTPRDKGVPDPSVTDLQTATDAYWSANSFREEQAAYHEILLFGGPDGWHNVNSRGGPTWRGRIARFLRLAAIWIEGSRF